MEAREGPLSCVEVLRGGYRGGEETKWTAENLESGVCCEARVIIHVSDTYKFSADMDMSYQQRDFHFHFHFHLLLMRGGFAVARSMQERR